MKKAILITLIISLVLLNGCLFDQKQATSFKSMDQLHQEDGVPVKIEEVRVDEFETDLKYTATLRARSEAVRYAQIADVVQDVYYNIGDYVRENETVVTFPENNQTTKYHQIKANYELAETTYRRMGRMYQEGVISKQELDSARTNFEVAKANLEATDDILRVKAPLSGYITQLNVKPTDNVSPGTPLFTVSNLDLIEAQIWASSKEADQIRVGQKVTLEWDGKLVQGSVIQVSQVMDSRRKAFEVKALFKNGDKVLTSGITADISIQTYNNEQAVVVSRRNLVEEDGKRFIYVVNNGKAIKREVLTGRERGTLIEVKSGLRPGEFMITEGSTMVADQTKVNIINS